MGDPRPKPPVPRPGAKPEGEDLSTGTFRRSIPEAVRRPERSTLLGIPKPSGLRPSRMPSEPRISQAPILQGNHAAGAGSPRGQRVDPFAAVPPPPPSRRAQALAGAAAAPSVPASWSVSPKPSREPAQGAAPPLIQSSPPPIIIRSGLSSKASAKPAAPAPRVLSSPSSSKPGAQEVRGSAAVRSASSAAAAVGRAGQASSNIAPVAVAPIAPAPIAPAQAAPAPPAITPDDEPVVLLVGFPAGLYEALSGVLEKQRVFVEAIEPAYAVSAVTAAAPDLVVLLGDGAEELTRKLLDDLAASPISSVVPIALVTDDPALGARLAAFRHGAAAVIPKSASVTDLAGRISELAREIPARGEGVGQVGEATLQELVDTLAKELRSGILSVRQHNDDRESVRLVLGRGRPLATLIDEFVNRVRDQIQHAEPLQYEFDERAMGTVELLAADLDEATDEASIAGVRVVLADDNAARADAVAQELRHRGAQVVVTDLAPSEAHLGRLRQLDPMVLVIGEQQLQGAGYHLVKSLREHRRLRWAALLVVPWGELWSEEHGVPKTQLLLNRLAGLAEPEEVLSARLKTGEAFDTRLESLGPARLVRALVAQRSLRVTIRNPRYYAQLSVAEGLLTGVVGFTQSGARLEGPQALAALLNIGSGRVRVEPSAAISATNLMATADVALGLAEIEEPAIPESIPAPPPSEPGFSLPALSSPRTGFEELSGEFGAPDGARVFGAPELPGAPASDGLTHLDSNPRLPLMPSSESAASTPAEPLLVGREVAATLPDGVRAFNGFGDEISRPHASITPRDSARASAGFELAGGQHPLLPELPPSSEGASLAGLSGAQRVSLWLQRTQPRLWPYRYLGLVAFAAVFLVFGLSFGVVRWVTSPGPSAQGEMNEAGGVQAEGRSKPSSTQGGAVAATALPQHAPSDRDGDKQGAAAPALAAEEKLGGNSIEAASSGDALTQALGEAQPSGVPASEGRALSLPTGEGTPAPSCEQALAGEDPIAGNLAVASREVERARRAIVAGDLKRAQKAYCNALTISPGETRIVNGLGMVLLMLGDGKQAAQLLQGLAERAEITESSARLLYADALALAGEHEEARRFWGEAEGQQGEQQLLMLAHINQVKAEQAFRQRDYLRAERLYRRAIVLAPEKIEAAFGLARSLRANGRVNSAIAWASYITEHRPENAEYWLLLGDLHASNQQGDSAKAAYQRGLALAPNHPELSRRGL